MSSLRVIPLDLSQPLKGTATLTDDLENGQIIYFSRLAFTLTEEEKFLLDPVILKSGRKNISYNPASGVVKGATLSQPSSLILQHMMKRFVDFTKTVTSKVFPLYQGHYHLGRTSFRPAEIEGRSSSPNQDDTRLHVDAFPSMPMGSKRILRFSANINTHKPRQWKVGEPFMDVVRRFLPEIKEPSFFTPYLSKALGLTKKRRRPYDHYMLQLHQRMKLDGTYQQRAVQETIDFPPGTCWFVYTDLVSHAAISGQHVLEQTLMLEVDNMKNPSKSPLKVLETQLGRPLI